MASHDGSMLGAEHDIVTVMATPAGDLPGDIPTAASVVTAELVVRFVAAVPTAASPALLPLRLPLPLPVPIALADARGRCRFSPVFVGAVAGVAPVATILSSPRLFPTACWPCP